MTENLNRPPEHTQEAPLLPSSGNLRSAHETGVSDRSIGEQRIFKLPETIARDRLAIVYSGQGGIIKIERNPKVIYSDVDGYNADQQI